MNEDSMPRYTWSRSNGRATILRREGLYGQTEIFLLSIPILNIGAREGQEAAELLPEMANVLVDYLDQRDRRLDKERSKGGPS